MNSECQNQEPVISTGNPHHDRQRCPACGSLNLKVTAEHDPKGYNGYECQSCGCQFGN